MVRSTTGEKVKTAEEVLAEREDQVYAHAPDADQLAKLEEEQAEQLLSQKANKGKSKQPQQAAEEKPQAVAKVEEGSIAYADSRAKTLALEEAVKREKEIKRIQSSERAALKREGMIKPETYKDVPEPEVIERKKYTRTKETEAKLAQFHKDLIANLENMETKDIQLRNQIEMVINNTEKMLGEPFKFDAIREVIYNKDIPMSLIAKVSKNIPKMVAREQERLHKMLKTQNLREMAKTDYSSLSPKELEKELKSWEILWFGRVSKSWDPGQREKLKQIVEQAKKNGQYENLGDAPTPWWEIAWPEPNLRGKQKSGPYSGKEDQLETLGRKYPETQKSEKGDPIYSNREHVLGALIKFAQDAEMTKVESKIAKTFARIQKNHPTWAPDFIVDLLSSADKPTSSKAINPAHSPTNLPSIVLGDPKLVKDIDLVRDAIEVMENKKLGRNINAEETAEAVEKAKAKPKKTEQVEQVEQVEETPTSLKRETVKEKQKKLKAKLKQEEQKTEAKPKAKIKQEESQSVEPEKEVKVKATPEQEVQTPAVEQPEVKEAKMKVKTKVKQEAKAPKENKKAFKERVEKQGYSTTAPDGRKLSQFSVDEIVENIDINTQNRFNDVGPTLAILKQERQQLADNDPFGDVPFMFNEKAEQILLELHFPPSVGRGEIWAPASHLLEVYPINKFVTNTNEFMFYKTKVLLKEFEGDNLINPNKLKAALNDPTLFPNDTLPKGQRTRAQQNELQEFYDKLRSRNLASNRLVYYFADRYPEATQGQIQLEVVKAYHRIGQGANEAFLNNNNNKKSKLQDIILDEDLDS